MSARYIVGDVFDVLRSLPDDSVDLVMTSPPFYGLRSYLPNDSPLKPKEIGSEATPGEYMDTLLDVVEEVRRVLAPHGSICWELGDSFSGSGGAGGDYNDGGLRDGQERFNGSAAKARAHAQKKRTRNPGPDFPLDKCLIGIPDLFQFCLTWGFNPLTGRTTPRWRVRNKIVWCRPNPPVGALGDKVRPATSYLTVACAARDRYFDLDAVREPYADITLKNKGRGQRTDVGDSPSAGALTQNFLTHAGAPPLDYWVIPTHPFPGAHYATFPPALCIKPIEAMCPRKVCRVCGVPSRRITSVEYEPHGIPEIHNAEPKARADVPLQQRTENAQGMEHGRATKNVETLGWTDCGHDAWRPGVTLDPFAGSGTTLQVATGHGRDAIGIDLDERNAQLAEQRIGGLFLEVVHFDKKGAA